MTNGKFNMTYWPVNAESELVELRSFLSKSALPADDIRLQGNLFGFYRNESGQIVGSGGLEVHGDFCLLRSLAVAQEFRGCGYGKEIVTDLITRAGGMNIRSVWLLTETAEHFFGKFGFGRALRETTPKEIRATTEFSSVCPTSAVVMSLNIVSP